MKIERLSIKKLNLVIKAKQTQNMQFEKNMISETGKNLNRA